MAGKPSLWDRYHFAGHAALAAACAGVWGIFVFYCPTGETVYLSISDSLPLLYRVSVTVSASLMGFSMTVTVFAMTLWNRAEIFVYTAGEPTYREQLWGAMRHATWSLGALAIASACCMLVSGDPSAVKMSSIPYLCLGIFAAFRLLRAIRLVHKMAAVVVASRSRQDPD